MWAIEHRLLRQTTGARDDGPSTPDQRAHELGVAPGAQLTEAHVKSIVPSTDSPDIPFDLSLEPYRGRDHRLRALPRAPRPTATSAGHRGSTSRPASS